MRFHGLYGLGALAALVAFAACGNSTKKLGGLGSEVPNGKTSGASSSTGAGNGEQYYCSCLETVSDPTAGAACASCLDGSVSASGTCLSLALKCDGMPTCKMIKTCLMGCKFLPDCIDNCILPLGMDMTHEVWQAQMDCACDLCAKQCTPPTPVSCAGTGGAGGAGGSGGQSASSSSSSSGGGGGGAGIGGSGGVGGTGGGGGTGG